MGNYGGGRAGWPGVAEFVVKWPVRLLFILFLVLAAAGNMGALQEGGRFPAFLVVTAVTAVCFLGVSRENGKPSFILILMAASILLHTIWAVSLKTQPVSDFQTLFDRAVLYAGGNTKAYHRPYFQTWAYQTVFSMYEALNVKIFGAAKALVALKILNGFWITLSNLMIYLLAKRSSGEKSARVAALLYFLYAGAWSMSTVLSNQFMGTAIMLSGVLLCLSRPAARWHRLALGGLVLGLGQAFRSDGVVWAIAVACAMLLPAGSAGGASPGRNADGPASGGDSFLNASRRALLVMIPFFGTGMILGWGISAGGVNPAGLGNGFPAWKLIEGLNDQSEGQYSQTDNDSIFEPHLDPSIPEADKRKKETAILKERWKKTPEAWMKLFKSKFRRLWVMEGDLHWAFGHVEGTSRTVSLLGKRVTLSADVFISWLRELERGSFLLVVLLSLFGVLPGRWGLRRDGPGADPRIPLFAALLLLAMLGIYLFVEVQLRYRISFLPVFFILAASGSERLFNLFIPAPRRKRGRRARA
jgi:hypothetical protein